MAPTILQTAITVRDSYRHIFRNQGKLNEIEWAYCTKVVKLLQRRMNHCYRIGVSDRRYQSEVVWLGPLLLMLLPLHQIPNWSANSIY